jgi:hypothetical protein
MSTIARRRGSAGDAMEDLDANAIASEIDRSVDRCVCSGG